LHAAIVQVLGVGVALRAVAEDRDGLALDQAQVTVLVVENFHEVAPVEILKKPAMVMGQTRRIRSPRPMPQAPVRTVSRMAPRSMASRKASFLPRSPVSSMV